MSSKTDWNQRFHDRLMELDATTLAEMYYRLRKELVQPPDGWFNFGSHSDKPDVELEFWGEGDDGLPIWERPKYINMFEFKFPSLGERRDLSPLPMVGDYPPFFGGGIWAVSVSGDVESVSYN